MEFGRDKGGKAAMHLVMLGRAAQHCVSNQEVSRLH